MSSNRKWIVGGLLAGGALLFIGLAGRKAAQIATMDYPDVDIWEPEEGEIAIEPPVEVPLPSTEEYQLEDGYVFKIPLAESFVQSTLFGEPQENRFTAAYWKELLEDTAEGDPLSNWNYFFVELLAVYQTHEGEVAFVGYQLNRYKAPDFAKKTRYENLAFAEKIQFLADRSRWHLVGSKLYVGPNAQEAAYAAYAKVEGQDRSG